MKPREPILDGDVQAGSSTSFNRPVSPKASRLDAVPSVNDNLPTSETRLCGPPNNKKVVKDPLSQNVDDLKGDRSSSLAGSPTPGMFFSQSYSLKLTNISDKYLEA